ncbi:MAG: trehalose-phosphatase [Candidatus Omnitrophota bacterium]
MKHLAKEWGKIENALKDKYLYVFLDFDGTLTPIRRKPGEVRLSRSTRDALRKLASRKNIAVAVISGRALRQARKMIGVKGIIYAGNHGLEAEGPGLKFTVPGVLRAKKTISAISKKLKKEIRPIKGALVEDKGLTLSVHYRMVSRSRQGELGKIFNKITTPYRSSGKVVVTSGKKVWEVRPPVKWNKGKAALELLRREKRETKKSVTSFYIGDDRTDEDAFRLLKRRSYTVKVGKKGRKNSLAKYYLRNTKEVRDFLKKLLTSKRKESHV